MTQLRSITHGVSVMPEPEPKATLTPTETFRLDIIPNNFEVALAQEWPKLKEVKNPRTHSNTWAKGKPGEYKPERQQLAAAIYRDLQENGPQLSRTIAERMGLATNTVSQLLQEIRRRHGTVEGKKDKTLGAFVWRVTKEASK